MGKKYKILFINPGASITGAPLLFVNMISWLSANSSIIPFILTSGSGPLEKKFHELAQTYKWDGEFEAAGISKLYLFRLLKRIVKKILPFKEGTYRETLLKELISHNFDLIYANSVSSSAILYDVKEHLTCKIILHIRELEISIFQFCGIELFHKVIPSVDLFIADAECVRMNLITNHGIDEEKVKMIYEYINYSDAAKTNSSEKFLDYSKLKKTIGIPEEAFIVSSCGTTDWRKGADLVAQIADKVRSKSNDSFHFIWIGGDSSGLEYQKLNYDLEKLNLQNSVHFLGIKENPLEYFAISDVFMLCSREEPVGIVALEAASLGKPILCFDQAGGMPEFVEEDCGFVLPYLDIEEMANHIILLRNDRQLLHRLGNNASVKVKRHDINIACKEIESLINSIIES